MSLQRFDHLPIINSVATRNVLVREAAGLSSLMLLESLKVTPMAALSRSVCGIRAQTLIVNLPGSKKASEECFTFILPLLPHAINLLRDDKQRVSATHKEVQGSPRTLASQTLVHTCPLHSPAEVTGTDDLTQVARRHRHSPWPLLEVKDALDKVLSFSSARGTESIDYRKARNRHLAESITAPAPLPPFPASIKDGYAVRAIDGAGIRTVLSTSLAGDMPREKLNAGECMRINTGAPLPAGADAVVQVEDTKLVKSSQDGTEELLVEMLKAPPTGLDIRPVGSDIAEGQQVLSAGIKIKAAEIGILAAVGLTQVKCYERPQIAVMSTGNELVEPEDSFVGDGKIRDSNRATLIALLEEHGFDVLDMGIAKDNEVETREMIGKALYSADVVVTTGGVSMGEKDLVKSVLQKDFHAEIHFGRIFMKPGKPTTFATVSRSDGTKLFFGLPGNPVSATVTCQLFVLPSLRKMSGSSTPVADFWKVKLGADVNLDPRPEYMRALLSWKENENLPTATVTGNQISSRLLSVCSAQALVILPSKSQEQPIAKAGTVLDAMLL
ncbi:gephyrin-like isoform X2 [Watersipora subatra]|uniref:gephyrin-like isoform X2 n=1 Tax=Watersipora subatra TaxID=2589382 RepID=UPI00355B56E2